MVRHHRMKGQKRKKREENYDREEMEQMIEEEKATIDTHDEPNAEQTVDELPGIPVVTYDQSSKAGAIFVLERASLEVAKVGKSYQILNSEDHSNFLRRNNKNPADYRPDIVHQLLQKLSIAAVGKREKLLRVIKNPVTQYFPVNSRKIGFSYSSEKSFQMQDYVAAISDDVNPVFVVGAMAHGKIDKEYMDDYISISDYPLSAAWCIFTICGSLQQKWKIF
ncbi:uncharacterized protein LOC131161851 isoform X2 [Malania oleifera]|uniref:uncharacterized protein LOC131161851 isoform X2 n=1 Tax=Malania oleifera TaxID=397392 RepID=UPI0025ADD3CF|nr:uncharacterized protein LOC131161851 isoform X2 [Malania oleifera]